MKTRKKEYGDVNIIGKNVERIRKKQGIKQKDFISKLGLFIGQKKAQTKYTALNININLTIEQRKTLERVFDLITQEYDKKTAEKFVNTISNKF